MQLDTNTRDNVPRQSCDCDESLQADVTAEDEGGDEHENNKKHGSNGVDCGQLRDVVNANLVINRHTHYTRFSEASARCRLFSCGQEFQPRNKGRMRVSHSLHSRQVECSVDIDNSL